MADYACQEPDWVYVAPPCRKPEVHGTGHCGCSYVAILAMREKELTAIRERDASFGEQIPDHWQGPKDRRTLLRLLDEALHV